MTRKVFVKRTVKGTVVHSGARVYHYGWVRTPEAMQKKTFFMDQLYHGNPTEEQKRTGYTHTGDNYRYKKFWGLRIFQGSHPAAMLDRIQKKGWHWDLSHSAYVGIGKAQRVALDLVERLTGVRLFEYRSYRLIRTTVSKESAPNEHESASQSLSSRLMKCLIT